ncbi:unnamed protein product [Ophioblennius macclurei]
MRQPLLLIGLLLADVLAQNQVPVEFQQDPVLVQAGTDILFTVLTAPQVFSITWQYQGGIVLGSWSNGVSQVNPVPQFLGRVTIGATQLRIGNAQLDDAGSFTVEVVPLGTGQANSKSAQLRVFDAVAGVSLTVPSVAVEERNVTLTCTWTAGTEITVQWGKDGSAVTADSRITISGGSLIINPARRSDAGEYTCTASNPVSGQSASQRLTIFYGPDTPVLTLETPKDCVGEGDVMVGQTVRLTCVSDSLPPALFTWQHDGQSVTPSQPDSGVLSLQTLTTNQSGRYVCIARNAISEGTSEQGRDLAVVGVCFNGGEVAGIVIGALLALLIIILLIVLIIVLVRRRNVQQRQRDTVLVPKTNPDPQIQPPEPQPNGVRELDQGPNPPLFYTRLTDRLNATLRGSRGNPQTSRLNGPQNSDMHQHNGRTHTNGLLHNAIQNPNLYPHNGIDNQAFTHTDAQNANTLANTQPQQNSNILIQSGTAQGGAQPPAVQVSLNTLPQTAQPNSNAQMPTIHVNLNSYPTNSQQTQQDSSLPLSNTASNNASQFRHNHTPGIQSGQSYSGDPRTSGRVNTGEGLIPTGYTHFNANTQTYQQDPESHRRSDRDSGRREDTPSSRHQQMPWDQLRGTPAYPNGTSDSTEYTSRPPVREARTNSRPQPQSQTASRSRTPPTRDASSPDRKIWNRLADLRRAKTSSVAQLSLSRHTQRSSGTQTESAQADIRGLPVRQNAPRQEATQSNNPQALPLMSQQASVGRSAVSRGPATQQGLTALQGADTRALADPNHLQQAHMAQQHRAAPIQTLPQGLRTQTQSAVHSANQPRQGGSAPVARPSAQPNPSNLTQAALKAHTENARVFKSRKQQTHAALLHSGQQTQAPTTGGQRAPVPPPVIPLAHFQTLPRERTQHKSPTRGPQPPRPPVNVPTAQRPKHRSANHHHRPANGQRHAHVQGQGHGHPAHPTQQQAHRGRPR